MKFIAYVDLVAPCARAQCEFEVPDDDLEGLTGSDREAVIDAYAESEQNALISRGWYEAPQ